MSILSTIVILGGLSIVGSGVGVCLVLLVAERQSKKRKEAGSE